MRFRASLKETMLARDLISDPKFNATRRRHAATRRGARRAGCDGGASREPDNRPRPHPRSVAMSICTAGTLLTDIIRDQADHVGTINFQIKSTIEVQPASPPADRARTTQHAARLPPRFHRPRINVRYANMISSCAERGLHAELGGIGGQGEDQDFQERLGHILHVQERRCATH